VDVAITPDGTAAYVTNTGSDNVSVIDTATRAIKATIMVGRSLYVAVTPNGAKAYVTDADSNTVSVINTRNNTLIATVAVGAHPVNAAITPDGSSVYVTDAGANSVTVINIANDAVVATLRAGAFPVDVSITPDGADAYVTNAGSKSVSVIQYDSQENGGHRRRGIYSGSCFLQPRRGARLRDQCWLEFGLSHRHQHQYGERHRAGWSSSDQRRLFIAQPPRNPRL
jgi:YVTN family beta-propeller protein